MKIQHLYFFLPILILHCSNNFPDIDPTSIFVSEIKYTTSDTSQKTGLLICSVPRCYDKRKSWPVVVTLHGAGSNAEAFHDLWKSTADSLGFVLVTLQGDIRTKEGFGWAWSRNPDRFIQSCLSAVTHKIHTDNERIYIAGFSAGGRAAYKLGLAYPQIFRGIAALSTTFDERFLSVRPYTDNRQKIYIGHGSLERRHPYDAAHAAQSLKKAGYKVKSVCYEGIGHGLPEPKEAELARILKYLDSDF